VGHDTVQALFVGELINKRKRYPSELRDTFSKIYSLRQIADYDAVRVSEIQMARALRRARSFVNIVHSVEGQ